MKISSFEYNSLIWFVLRACYIGISLSNVMNIAGRDAPLAALLALILGLFPLFIFIYLRNYDSDKNIGELNISLYNRLGKLLNIFLIVGTFLFIEMAFIDLISFVGSQFLFKTNFYYIAFAIIIPIIYALYKGIDTVSKMSLIMFYFVIFIIVCVILGVFKSIDINNLKPFLQTDKKDIVHAVIILVSYHVLPLFLLLIVPKKNITNYSIKKTLLFYFLSFFSLVNATFLTTTIFGPKLSLLYEFPEFHVLKKAEMGDFVDRIESIFSLEWIIALIILIIIGIYFIKEMFKVTFNFKEKTNQLLVLIICLLLIFIGKNIFVTNASASSFYEKGLLIIMFLVFMGIPLISFVKIFLKKHFFN